MTNDKSIAPSEPPVSESVRAHAAWFRLIDQLEWYDSKSQRCQRWYKGLKFLQITLAILIPLTSLLSTEYAKWGASIAGAVIALLEATQHMNQYSTLWFSYRATAERLKHEKYLFLSAAGPYRNLTEPEKLVALAERIEEHVSTEHANWFNETNRTVLSQKQEHTR